MGIEALTIPSSINPQEGESDDDGINLEGLRLSQDFTANLGVTKVLVTVPVRKPYRQEFFRVHPGEDWRLETMILELKERHETYLVDPNLWAEMAGELVPKVLYTVMNRQGILSLWPIRLPGEGGRLDSWNQSALEAAVMAHTHWIRIVANMSLGAYDIYRAKAKIQEPEWPDITFKEVLGKAFKGRFINSLDHPVVLLLRGEI